MYAFSLFISYNIFIIFISFNILIFCFRDIEVHFTYSKIHSSMYISINFDK